MQTARCVCYTAMVAALVGCGGESSGPTASYAFAPPPMSSQRTYAVTDVNPTSTSVNTVIQTVTKVNPDGSFSYHEDVPPGIPINGPNYQPGDYTDDSSGHLLTFTPIVGFPCTATPRGPGPIFPVTVGEKWQWMYGYLCAPPGSLVPVPLYTETGSVADIESITVPAGTFAAVKLQSTITWQTGLCNGGCTETLTLWLSVANGELVKSTANYNYGTSGTLTTTALLSETRELVTP